ncbi:MAG: hypothetical protein WCH39_14210 [Schlesneria sp.]
MVRKTCGGVAIFLIAMGMVASACSAGDPRYKSVPLSVDEHVHCSQQGTLNVDYDAAGDVTATGFLIFENKMIKNRLDAYPVNMVYVDSAEINAVDWRYSYRGYVFETGLPRGLPTHIFISNERSKVLGAGNVYPVAIWDSKAEEWKNFGPMTRAKVKAVPVPYSTPRSAPSAPTSAPSAPPSAPLAPPSAPSVTSAEVSPGG